MYIRPNHINMYETLILCNAKVPDYLTWRGSRKNAGKAHDLGEWIEKQLKNAAMDWEWWLTIIGLLDCNYNL